MLALLLAGMLFSASSVLAYVLPSTGRQECYSYTERIPCPKPGEEFYGQDGNYHMGLALSFRNNGDGTITDLNTGLIWEIETPAPSSGGDYYSARAFCEYSDRHGADDWRVPAILEYLSVMDKSLLADPDNPMTGAQNSPYYSSTRYLVNQLGFWVYHANGDTEPVSQLDSHSVRCVRGASLPAPSFTDNGDGSITDQTTGLTWEQNSSASSMYWKEALSWCENSATAGKTDWRLPNKKELESLLDFSRLPTIDPLFNADGQIRNWFYSSTVDAPGKPFIIRLSTGDEDLGWSTYHDARVRCVRGGSTDIILPVAYGTPSSMTSLTSGVITVGGFRIAAYRYRLDDGAWSDEIPVSVPISYSGLADGPHRLDLLAKNDEGQWQSVDAATSISWTVDTVPPESATFSGAPAGTTNSTIAEIVIDDENGTISHYRWSLDGSSWSDSIGVATPLLLQNLSDGEHVLSIEVRDGAGNWQVQPTTRAWTVSTSRPDTDQTLAFSFFGPVPLPDPRAVAVDASGNVYVTEASENRVVKYSPDGTFVRMWGSLGSGEGRFNNPAGLAVGPSGDVYVADAGNARIQKFSADGAFLSAFGSYGAGSSQFQSLKSVALDSSGRIYVADWARSVRRFSSTGLYQCDLPSSGTSVTVDGAGNIYVTWDEFNTIWKVSAALANLGEWGSAGSGDGQFDMTAAVAAGPSGAVYVADRNNHRIQKFTTSGSFVGKFGSQGSAEGEFEHPSGVAEDASGNVYVADSGNHRVQKFSSSGAVLDVLGAYGTRDGQFKSVSDIALDAQGNVYALDGANNRVQKFSPTGALLAKWGSQGTGQGQFDAPVAIAASPDGSIYVADAGNSRVQKFSASGVFQSAWGSSGGGDGQFSNLASLATDSSGNVYVAEASSFNFHRRIQKFTGDGAFLTSFGGYGQGPGLFNGMIDVTVGPDDVVHVADSAGLPQKFSSEGIFLSEWGKGYIDYAQAYATQIATDAEGNIYTASEYGAVKKYAADGTFVGYWGGLSGKFGTISGLTVDAAGNVYVADAGKFLIHVGQPTALRASLSSVPDAESDRFNYAFAVLGSAATTQYKYRLDGGSWSEAFSLGTPLTLFLQNGPHVLDIVGGDQWDSWQATPSTVSWTVNASEPTAVVTGAPTQPTRLTTLVLTVSGARASHYKYRLDGREWSAERDIATKISLSGLSEGDHSVSVLARDAVGNWQTTPTTTAWTVDRMPPVSVTLSGAPLLSTSLKTATITVSGADVVKYRYRLDGGAWSAAIDVSKEITLSNLATGSHTLAVLGIDAAGNQQPESTKYTWTVRDAANNMGVLLLL